MKTILIFILSALLMSCSSSPKTGYSGHGADSVSPELLEKFAPKPIPPEKLELKPCLMFALQEWVNSVPMEKLFILAGVLRERDKSGKFQKTLDFQCK